MRGWLALWLALSGTSVAGHAQAYCRTRTCAAENSPEPCIRDEQGCALNGAALYWPVASVDVWVDPRGSPKRGIDASVAREILDTALRTWTSVDCPNGGPSIDVGRVELLTPETAIKLGLTLVDPDAGASEPSDADKRASLFSFVDDEWTHTGNHVIALTTISFGTESGRIVGADIEVNSAAHNITTSEALADYDLASLLTHEAGHLWGLDDLETPGPTMYGYYGGAGDLGPRTLDADDENGICTIYPAGRFDEGGGCGCESPARDPRSALFAGLALVALALRRRRRLG